MGLEEELTKHIGENDHNQDVSDWLTTGILPLNKIMSGSYQGGFPVGRITEIYGGESSGKTMIATMAMIETQKKGGVAAMLDFEHAFSLSRAVELGLDIDPKHWIYKQPATAEEGFGVAQKISEIVRKHESEKHVTIVFDSIASMVTKAELEAGFDESNMKTKLSLAVCMAVSLKIIAGVISRTNVTLIFLNQTRDNPGIMFGDKESTPGGKAMKFYASLRLRLGKRGKIKGDDGGIIGEDVVAKTIKNKVYAPFKESEYCSSFNEGVDVITTHLNYLKTQGKLGATSGYLEFEGKKYRTKQLAKMARENKEVNDKVLALFTE